jgi:MFS transporter, DHA3 family, macrolide efflux protein
MSGFGPLWRNPKFTRLWDARLVSRFGSALGYVVLIWLTFAETGSSLAVAYVGLAEFIPTVGVGLLSGALVDRLDRRRVIIVSVLGRSAAMAALVLALELLGFHLVLIVAASAVFALCATFFAPGSQALLPEIVAKEHLDRANGLFESSESVVGIAGNAVAGVLILAVGAVPSLGVDALGYLVAALFIVWMGATTTLSGPDRPPAEPLLHQVREGLRYLGRTLGLLEITLISLVLNFLFSFVLTFFVVYTADLLHGSALVYGVLEALLAAGWGLGGLLVGRFRLTRFTGRLAAASGIADGVAVLGLVFVPVVPVALAVFLAIGVVQGVTNVAWLSTVQAIVPERLQGRYFATDNMLSFAGIPAAQIVGGVLITLHGISFTFLLAGLGCLVAGGVGLLLRELRSVGYDPRRPAERAGAADADDRSALAPR